MSVTRPMLESTFIHCSGIGPKTERLLWQSGAHRWMDYLSMAHSLKAVRRFQSTLVPLVEESLRRLDAGDFRWFGSSLPPREHWRGLGAFVGKTAFLDIETTGGPDGGLVTVIGLYDGANLRQYIRGNDLERFVEDVQEFSTLVTFFGAGFDLPVLRRAFHMDFPQLHVDLCFLMKRLGYSGGLKIIEEKIGIRRSPETAGLCGFDAVRLWWSWRGGNRAAMDTLLAYNAEDVVNLERILEFAYPQILRETLGDSSREIIGA